MNAGGRPRLILGAGTSGTTRGFPGRRLLVLGIATLVVLFGISIGIRLVGSLLRGADDARVTGRGSGWVAVSVALTEWNTPGGPTFESLGGPARIAMFRDGRMSPTYVGGARPPAPGASVDEWLAVRQQCPSFSPGGSRLLYVEEPRDLDGQGMGRFGDATIVIAPTDRLGLPLADVIRWPSAGMKACPAWSPDGRRVALVDGADSITIIGLDGTRQSLSAPIPGIHSLAWSADGTSIAVIERSFPNGSGEEGSLWVIPVGGGARTLLYDSDTPMTGPPSWSPDGASIAIAAAVQPEPTPNAAGRAPSFRPEFAVTVVPVHGGAARVIGRGVDPSWSPTGTHIAYVSVAEELFDAGEIVLVDPSGRDPQRIPSLAIAPGTPLSDYNSQGGRGVWQAHAPVWSADGETLLFIGTDGGWGTSRLLAVAATGDEVPVVMSETWVAEWLFDGMVSSQAIDP